MPPDLLSFITFAAAVIQIMFDGYWIIWVDCGCFWWHEFCTQLIFAAMSRFCWVLTLLVVTKAVVLVVFLFLLRHWFTVSSLAGYFSIHCWVLQPILDNLYFSYHLVGLLISTPFYFLCLVLHVLLNHVYRDLLFLQICRICLLFLLYQLSWPACFIHNFLMIVRSLRKGVV